MDTRDVSENGKRSDYKWSLAVGVLVSLGGNIYFRLAPSLVSALLAMVGDVMVLYSSVWCLWVAKRPRGLWTGRGIAAVVLGLLLAIGIVLAIGAVEQLLPDGSQLVNQ